MSIDLYRIYQLDRQQPPEALAQQLTERLSATDPSDSLTRGRIETARAILGDSQRRAIYDQQLGDPAAPPVTEQVLAALAGKPVPSAPSITLTSLFASTQGKIIVGGAIALVLILLVVIAVAAISGDEDGGGAAVTASSLSDGKSSRGSGEVIANTRISRTAWGKKDSRPSSAIVLTKETPLPADFDPERSPNGAPCSSSGLYGFPGIGAGLVQYQDKSSGYVLPVLPEGSESRDDSSLEIAVLDPQGNLVSTTTYTPDDWDTAPEPFDLMKESTKGYARVEATDGISIPAEAAGDEDGKNFATCILPDAFDETLLWVTMRGSSSVYQAQIREVGA